MNQPGWYPDPSGAPGRYRFWDGKGWSTSTSADPDTPAPPGPPRRPQRVRTLVLVGLALVVLVVASVVVMVTERHPLLSGPGVIGTPTDPCPVDESAVDGPTDRPVDGRVHGGALSYPLLDGAWSAPRADDRVPFGRDVHLQTVELARTDANLVWYASVLVAELDAGAGFLSPEPGAQLVVRCLLDSFYGNAEVERDDQVNEAMRVDGRDAWRIESRLGYRVPGISDTGELLIVVVVDVGGGRGGLFYASVPDSAASLLPTVRATLAQLTVD